MAMNARSEDIKKDPVQEAKNLLDECTQVGIKLGLSTVGTIRIKYPENFEESYRKGIYQRIIQHKVEMIRLIKHRDQGDLIIQYWLSDIGEKDQELIDDTMERCHRNRNTRAYFIKRARDAKRNKSTWDDKRS